MQLKSQAKETVQIVQTEEQAIRLKNQIRLEKALPDPEVQKAIQTI